MVLPRLAFLLQQWSRLTLNYASLAYIEVSMLCCMGRWSHTGMFFAQGVKGRIEASVEIAKRSELHTFKVMPKRWVVGRSFAWLGNVVACGKTANAYWNLDQPWPC